LIYTVTLNPAVDYVVSLDALETGAINRAASENVVFGGKGINVSLMLRALETPSAALGFIAGFTGEAIRAGVEVQGVRTDFVALESGFSRINVKLHAGEETEINGAGPEIPPEKLELFFQKLQAMTDADTLVLSGSVPPSLPGDIYARIAGIAGEKGARLIVDAAGKLLLSALPYRPFLVKPNREELAALFDAPAGTDEAGSTPCARLHGRRRRAALHGIGRGVPRARGERYSCKLGRRRRFDGRRLSCGARENGRFSGGACARRGGRRRDGLLGRHRGLSESDGALRTHQNRGEAHWIVFSSR